MTQGSNVDLLTVALLAVDGLQLRYRARGQTDRLVLTEAAAVLLEELAVYESAPAA